MTGTSRDFSCPYGESLPAQNPDTGAMEKKQSDTRIHGEAPVVRSDCGNRGSLTTGPLCFYKALLQEMRGYAKARRPFRCSKAGQ